MYPSTVDRFRPITFAMSLLCRPCDKYDKMFISLAVSFGTAMRRAVGASNMAASAKTSVAPIV